DRGRPEGPRPQRGGARRQHLQRALGPAQRRTRLAGRPAGDRRLRPRGGMGDPLPGPRRDPAGRVAAGGRADRRALRAPAGRRPDAGGAKWIETASGLWTILMYLSLGAVPLLWRAWQAGTGG